jgi:hypothetical protein
LARSLLIDLVAKVLHERSDGLLERQVRVFGRWDVLVQLARLGVLEEPLEDARPVALRTV